ncbi:hypothetical protein CYLTODRAFT_209468 [Cylindrobasidium torrendii FP15055 ss-10]|uniref:Uncharacterized protein n=1 Tax=Cylindrobasidium torrendii FP15055 ss-10 TaxID=1314674 RepID=A0A0D7BHA1_9AGAR|nr:hypothetical protein CYLTODRAFT_209468 [Cylindrobasidium torrendii FP15055 ss-10]
MCSMFIGVTFLLGRVYSCTLFYTLNNRIKLNDPNVRDDHCITFSLGGILIHREAVVVTDGQRSTRSDTATALSIVVLPAPNIASPAQSPAPLDKDFNTAQPFADLPLIDEKEEEDLEDGQTLVRARHALDRRRSSDSSSRSQHGIPWEFGRAMCIHTYMLE